MNVNLRVQFSTYITLSVWQGNFNVYPMPLLNLNIANPGPIANTTIQFLAMDPLFYVQLAEVRIFQLDTAKSWGQYLKYYNEIWPVPSSFALQVQYYTSYGDVLYLDISNPSKAQVNTGAPTFSVTRCGYGQYVVQATPGGAVTCSPCANSDCLICPANYNNVCKLCSSLNATKACVEDQTTCPFNFYPLNGLCFACPPGCQGCTSPLNCLACSSGLNMYKNLTAAICVCPNGNYGVGNTQTGVLSCFPCDPTKCQYCQGSASFCTQCYANLNLYLYGSQCVANCATQVIPSFTNTTIQACQNCGQYCTSCVNSTFCNPKKCLWQWGNPTGVISYNHNGQCLIYCPDNTLSNNVTQTCDDCGPNCAVCSIITINCTVCNIGYVLNNNLCISTCPPGKYPDTSNVCQFCPSQCVLCLAASQCTTCKNFGPNPPAAQTYYYVNYQCVTTCPDRYYKDGSNVYNLFCRSCPSGCNQCLDDLTCTVCDAGWYLDYFYAGTHQLCVSKCQPGRYPDNSTVSCKPCLTGCQTCDNATSCTQCMLGQVLVNTGGVKTCAGSCGAGTYSDATNTCQNCISGCTVCADNHTCIQCSLGYFLVQDTLSCVAGSCPVGYYTQGANCLRCQTQCATCATPSTCSSCIVGYQFQGSQCISKCGNGAREDNEQCDDGNSVDGDGCSSGCLLETQYVCMPLDPTTTGPDVCYCDPVLQSASWTSYWGEIDIIFQGNVVFNNAVIQKSTDSQIFCTQILDPSMLPTLGTTYSCFLDSSSTGSSLRINVDLDSTLGNGAMNYQTQVLLIKKSLVVQNCPASIPLSYSITNLPLDSPIVYFQSTSNNKVVPKCSQYWGLNLFTSKGFTKRNIGVQWTVISMNPDNSDLRTSIQSYLDTNYLNVKYFELLPDQIESLAGTTMFIKAQVTNFLGIVGTNSTTITFSNMKQMLIIDLQDIYTFQTAVDNQLAPRVRIPYCAADNANTQQSDLKSVQVKCTLYSSDLSLQTPLTNCTILAFNMTLGNSYMVKVEAINILNPNMGTTKWVHIDTASPLAEIAYIKGCDRLFSVDNDFQLEAMIVTNASFAKFNWYCTDSSTGSPCFTTSFSYITMTNTQTVTIGGGQLFSNNTYLFKVIVFDTLSQSQSIKTCNMYAAPSGNQVFDMIIDTEANRNGYIDFNAQMAAFKVQALTTSTLDLTKLTFKWTFTDSSGTVFPPSKLSIYYNSLGVLIKNLARSNTYQVECNATYGNSTGYIKTFYATEPTMNFEFSVEPPTGEPLMTVFTFSVTSQDTLDGLYYYVFGYVNPADGISNIPIYQKTFNRYQRTQLPVPTGQSYLTCYAQVMLPSGESKTYLQNVTMTAPTITASMFSNQLNAAVMDNLVESMQINNKLIILSNQMTLAQQSQAINLILLGLKNEITPLSDYYIQSSVSSLLQYTSLQVKSLMSDANIVTVAAALFKQMTILENNNIANGEYSQFGRAATSSLYNFANNLFQKDFTSLIGAGSQLSMKVMFMQGLGNVLRGSMSDQILGDIGGFFFQGQNIYVKAVKFDLLESSYQINASLPISLSGTLAQNFVNISLPSASSGSNPCKGLAACQVSIIILDQPVNAFLSSAKDAVLKSMYVDLSVSQTELSSPYSLIQIADLSVKNLASPIQLTIPLTTEFTDAASNRTLGCGYLDPIDQIFKLDGLSTVILNTKLVTCQATHLTAIGVTDYAVDTQNQASALSVVSSSNLTSSANNGTASVTNGGTNPWAQITAGVLIVVLIAGAGWGYTKDKRDELNPRQLTLNKEKIYMNLFLDPLPSNRLNGDSDEDDYDHIQQQRAQQLELRRKRYEERMNKYQKIDDNTPVKGLFTPEELFKNFGIDEDGTMTKKVEEEKKEAAAKKKKKKVKTEGADLFFEGGYPEYVPTQYEGGEDEEGAVDLEDEAAASVVVKGKKGKKKKKKKATTASNADETLRSQVLKEEASPDPTSGPSSPMKTSIKIEDGILEDIDGVSARQKSDKKSKRSLGKKKRKTLKPKKEAEPAPVVEEPPEEQVQFNNTNFGGFQFNGEAPGDATPKQEQVSPQVVSSPVEETKSLRSKKGSKRKGRGAKSSSRKEQQLVEEEKKDGFGEDDPNNDLKPDFEAEEISPSRKRKPNFEPQLPEFQQPNANEEEGGLLNKDLNYDYQRSEAPQSSIGKKSTKKKKTLKKKKKKKEEKQEEDEDEEEEEEEQKKVRDEHSDDPSGSCHFCFWNYREGHRCLSYFAYYNNQLSRPTRWSLLVMSWYLFMTFSGYFIGAQQYIGDKSTRMEQLMCGFLAALFARPWVLGVTYFLMHPKPNAVMELIESKIKAKNIVKVNQIKFYVGVAIMVITNLYAIGEAFALSNQYSADLGTYWAWAFLFAIIADLVAVDGIFMIFVTTIAMKVGVTPDACGKDRAFWLKMIPPAIKDSIE